MKYAIVNDEKREAERGLTGACPICEVPVKPRCGRIRVPHWYHPPGHFDHRWEPETEWHRNWKNLFPKECQEVCHRAENGERHLADVKTVHGQVLEFQNSPISEEERASREAIYRPLMCWVVNGLKAKNDRRKFFEALRLRKVASTNPLTFVVSMEECVLLRKWESSQTFVFLDFGEAADANDTVRFDQPVLWTLRPGTPKGQAVLMPVNRAHFVEAMIRGEPVKGLVTNEVRPPVRQVPHITVSLPPQPWRRPRRNWRL